LHTPATWDTLAAQSLQTNRGSNGLVFALEPDRFRLRQILNALHRLEVEFAPDPFTLSINQAEGVATIAVHVPMVLGSRDQRTESSPDVETLGCVTSNPTWRWDLYNWFADCASECG